VVAKHVLTTLGKDGTWMIVEPFAHDHVEENLNPVGRVFYAASTLICTPASLAQEVGLDPTTISPEFKGATPRTKVGSAEYRVLKEQRL